MVLTAGFLLLQGRLLERSGEKPVFLQTDTIALAHQTKLEVSIHSMYTPDSVQLETLKKDYSNLWAHLNHVYATNDVTAGKEYYTEPWFRQLCAHYQNGLHPTGIQRQDSVHHLAIQNWASDGLVCTAIDSNLVFKYQYPDNSFRLTSSHIALVLLYQGDHWRIDAMRVINETPL